MKPRLKALHSPDIDLESYVPESDDFFSFLLEASIGTDERDGSDLFSVTVCTPRWLLESVNSPMWGARWLIVPHYSLKGIRELFEQACRDIEAESWEEIALRLSRFAAWEFENYRSEG